MLFYRPPTGRVRALGELRGWHCRGRVRALGELRALGGALREEHGRDRVDGRRLAHGCEQLVVGAPPCVGPRTTMPTRTMPLAHSWRRHKLASRRSEYLQGYL